MAKSSSKKSTTSVTTAKNSEKKTKDLKKKKTEEEIKPSQTELAVVKESSKNIKDIPKKINLKQKKVKEFKKKVKSSSESDSGSDSDSSTVQATTKKLVPPVISDDSSDSESDSSSEEAKKNKKKASVESRRKKEKPDVSSSSSSDELDSDEDSDDSSESVVAEYTQKVLKDAGQKPKADTSSDSDSSSDNSDDTSSSSAEEKKKKKVSIKEVKKEESSDEESEDDSDSSSSEKVQKPSSKAKIQEASSDSSDSEKSSESSSDDENDKSEDTPMEPIKEERQSPFGTGIIKQEWISEMEFTPNDGYAPVWKLKFSDLEKPIKSAKDLPKNYIVEFDNSESNFPIARIVESNGNAAPEKQPKKRIMLSEDNQTSNKKQNIAVEKFEVFAGGFPFGTTETEIRDLFEESCGPVSRVKVLGQGGAAFIQFFKKEGVDSALQWDQTEYKGRKLNINLASDRPNKGGQATGDRRMSSAPEVPNSTVIVRNIPFSVTEDDIHNFFANISQGSVQSIRIPVHQDTGNIRGFAMVGFSSTEAAQAALEYSGSDLAGRTIQIEIARPREQSTGPRGGGFNRGGNRGGGQNNKQPFRRQSTGSHQIFDE